MKILQLFDATYPQVSGYSMRSKYITDNLKGMGYSLLVFSSPSYEYDSNQSIYNGVIYRHVSSWLYRKMKKIPVLRELCVIFAIVRVSIREWDDGIDVIDAHSSVLNGVSGVILKRIKKVPLVYEIRAFWEDAAVDLGKTNEGSLRYSVTRGIETFVVKNADRVTVICEGLKKDLIAREVDHKKIDVIVNGVELDKFKPIGKNYETLKEIGLEKDNEIVGFIGTFFEFEGLEMLIDAVPMMIEQNKNIRVVLVGGGAVEEILKKKVRDNNLQEYVLFIGRVPHEDINKYYSIMDIMVYPRVSKRITELVTPLKPLEAMALGKCVVVSDVGGLKELVENGETGVLFEAGNTNDLANSCVELLYDEQKRKYLKEKALQHVEQHRQWKDICQQYELIYSKVKDVKKSGQECKYENNG